MDVLILFCAKYRKAPMTVRDQCRAPASDAGQIPSHCLPHPQYASRSSIVLSIRLHHLNLFPDRKLIPLLDPIQPFLIRFPDNAKVRIFLQIGVVVVNLSLL